MLKYNSISSKRIPLRALLMCALAGSTLAPAYAQQVPLNPSVTVAKSARNVSVVNIATPNAQGVSHNVFKQFDVAKTGVILNNSAKNATSVIGGAVKGNTKVQTRAASLIVNEALFATSYLLGKVEVLGQKADVVIANPNGISCNGCGFVNASRVTLATAKPNFANGQLASFTVNRGTLTVSGNKVDVSNVDYFDLVGSGIKVNTSINGKDILVSAGAQVFEYGPSKVTAPSTLASIGPVIAVPSIETSALGGISGNNIRLISSGKHHGVNLSGQLTGYAVDVKADRDINLGKVFSSFAFVESKGKITTNGKVTTYWDGRFKGEKIDINSPLSIRRDLAVSADSSINFLKSGEASALMSVSLSAPEINIGNSNIDVLYNVSLNADKISQGTNSLIDGKFIYIVAKKEFNSSGSIVDSSYSRGYVKIDSPKILSSGTISSNRGYIGLNAINLDLAGKVSAWDFITITADNINLRGAINTNTNG